MLLFVIIDTCIVGITERCALIIPDSISSFA